MDDVLGYTAEEMIGKTPFDLMMPDEISGVGVEFAEIVREGRTFRNLGHWLRTRDGRSVCMLTSGGPILGDAGELLGYRGLDSDITERKNAENALKDRVKFEKIIAAIEMPEIIEPEGASGDEPLIFVVGDDENSSELLTVTLTGGCAYRARHEWGCGTVY